jgi:hypothetical protein
VLDLNIDSSESRNFDDFTVNFTLTVLNIEYELAIIIMHSEESKHFSCAVYDEKEIYKSPPAGSSSPWLQKIGKHSQFGIFVSQLNRNKEKEKDKPLRIFYIRKNPKSLIDNDVEGEWTRFANTSESPLIQKSEEQTTLPKVSESPLRLRLPEGLEKGRGDPNDERTGTDEEGVPAEFRKPEVQGHPELNFTDIINDG